MARSKAIDKRPVERMRFVRHHGWRSLFPRQVLIRVGGEKEGLAKLAKSFKEEIDEETIEAWRGTVSLPFELGKHKRVGQKIVDDRRIESLKILEVAG